MNLMNPITNGFFTLNYTPICLIHFNLTIWHVTMLNQLYLVHMVIQSYENVIILLKTLQTFD